MYVANSDTVNGNTTFPSQHRRGAVGSNKLRYKFSSRVQLHPKRQQQQRWRQSVTDAPSAWNMTLAVSPHPAQPLTLSFSDSFISFFGNILKVERYTGSGKSWCRKIWLFSVNIKLSSVRELRHQRLPKAWWKTHFSTTGVKVNILYNTLWLCFVHYSVYDTFVYECLGFHLWLFLWRYLLFLQMKRL